MSDKKLYIISGPSGAGLAEITASVFAVREDVSAVLPVTARKMKKGEIDGIGFRFYDLDEWNGLLESGDLLESTQFAGNDYGTSRKLVTEKLSEGMNVLINLEPDRALQIKKNMPESVFIYAAPSSMETLRDIYSKTAKNDIEVSVRMQIAQEQKTYESSADYRVNTDDHQNAVKSINEIIAQ